MVDDIIVNKIASIKKCSRRAREEYGNNQENFSKNFSAQDSAILNILRAYAQSIDLANHLVKLYNFGIPNNSSDGFKMMAENGLIDYDLYKKLTKMTGFRNIAVHQYQEIDLEIVISVINKNLNDLLEFSNQILKKKTEIEIWSDLQELPVDNAESKAKSKQKVIRAIIRCHQSYQKEMDKVSDLLNMWRKSQIINAISSHNSEFYIASKTSLKKFFEDEENISKEKKYADLLEDKSNKASDEVLENFIQELQTEISNNS